MTAKKTVLVIDDEPLMREFVRETLERAGYGVSVAEDGTSGLAEFSKNAYHVVVTDLKMGGMDGMQVLERVKQDSPSTEIVMMTAYGTVETAVAAMKAGAADYIMKPFAPDELELIVDRAIARRRLEDENQYLRRELTEIYDFEHMVGTSPQIQEVYETIRKVADSRASVLIEGESGTGKELVARAIHYSGGRRDKPFIKLNCAALASGLLESELFGHEKGAFTGAHQRRIGRFELADGGTLLLDEMGEISIALQAKLLRVLQEKEFERVGGTKPISVDTRILSTTNRNLQREVREGRFREDLYFRLNVIPIHLPPLRERKEDIPALVDHFIARSNGENGRHVTGISDELLDMFMNHSWPGNIRELENYIERAVVLSCDDLLQPKHFSFGLGDTAPRSGDGLGVVAGMTVAQTERVLIEATLDKCGQNRTRTAEVLGISVRTLRNKLKEYAQTDK